MKANNSDLKAGESSHTPLVIINKPILFFDACRSTSGLSLFAICAV
ncbi:hypothetical protein SynBIOSE41_03758 [Synechococcus sp. BIOS-E4-1]|nr:hypothetical protein SynBIOSE41_03758 [Synechococcus sp. BIOS-E4-1]